MKNVFLYCLIILGLGIAATESSANQNHLQLQLGFQASNPIFAVDFQHDLNQVSGIGAYFLNRGDDGDTNQAGILALGGEFRLRQQLESWLIYFSPGFGFASLDFVNPNVEDETIIGPSFKIGFSYELNQQVSLGVENLRLYNWFNDDVIVTYDFILATLAFNF